MMRGIDAYGPCEGELSIGGVDLRTAAWYVIDLVPLWQRGPKRGQNRLLPGVDGLSALPRRYTEATYNLPMLLAGSVSASGVPYSHNDPWRGLETNYEALCDALVDGSGTKTATLRMPSGATRTGAVQVLGITLGDGVAGDLEVYRRATLDLVIPAGHLA